MTLNLIFLLACGIVLFWFYKGVRKFGILWIVKGLLQLGILILFISGFSKLFVILPSNFLIKLIFCITYLWCTLGINVNFMIPLIHLIDERLDNNK